MPSPNSSFDGVPFQIDFGSGFVLPQVPKVPTRDETTHRGSAAASVNGKMSVQEMDRQWKPLILVFQPTNLPSALITQAMRAAFKNAEGHGIRNLILEGVHHSVIIDWRASKPIDTDEVTPTGEGAGAPYYITNVSGPAGRLYTGTIYLLEFVSAPSTPTSLVDRTVAYGHFGAR